MLARLGKCFVGASSHLPNTGSSLAPSKTFCEEGITSMTLASDALFDYPRVMRPKNGHCRCTGTAGCPVGGGPAIIKLPVGSP